MIGFSTLTHDDRYQPPHPPQLELCDQVWILVGNRQSLMGRASFGAAWSRWWRRWGTGAHSGAENPAWYNVVVVCCYHDSCGSLDGIEPMKIVKTRWSFVPQEKVD